MPERRCPARPIAGPLAVVIVIATAGGLVGCGQQRETSDPARQAARWRATLDDCEAVGGPVWRAIVAGDHDRQAAPPPLCPAPDDDFQEAWLGKVVPVVHQEQMLSCLEGQRRQSCEERHRAAQVRDWSATAGRPETGIYDYADATRRDLDDGCTHWRLRRLTLHLNPTTRRGAELEGTWEASIVTGAVCPGDGEAPVALRCRRVGVAPVNAGRQGPDAGYLLAARGLRHRGTVAGASAAQWDCAGILAEMPPGWRPPAGLARLCKRTALRAERPLATNEPAGCELSTPFPELQEGGALLRAAPLGTLMLVGRTPYRLLRRQAAAPFNR